MIKGLTCWCSPWENQWAAYLHRSSVLKQRGGCSSSKSVLFFSLPHPPSLVGQASALLSWDRVARRTLTSQHFILRLHDREGEVNRVSRRRGAVTEESRAPQTFSYPWLKGGRVTSSGWNLLVHLNVIFFSTQFVFHHCFNSFKLHVFDFF